MADFIQALADGLFMVLSLFEMFLDILNDIPFLDSGFTLLELFYAVGMLYFLIDFYRTIVVPADNPEVQEITDKIDDRMRVGL